MYLEHYLKELNYDNIPSFLIKYLDCPSLQRLKKIGYFCGMDYASKNIYNFSEYISRYDHSLTVALLVYKLTKNKTMTLAGLFHDIGTPCFSHVIDYMNNDFEKQESTEAYTEEIIKNDTYLIDCLKQDNIDILDIINFKKYSIVDNDRPKLCADRLDGIILTGSIWTKSISLEDITNIINDITIFNNEINEPEIGFKTKDIAKKVTSINDIINEYCHSKEDNYMMLLLAQITSTLINLNYITYKDLYLLDEEELFSIIEEVDNPFIKELLYYFKNIKREDIVKNVIPNIKNRTINPLVNNERLNGDIYTKGYKCFDKNLTNRYGMKFEIGKTYHTDGKIKFGNDGNGFHMCLRLEDTLRYFDAINNDVDICQVVGFGKKDIGEDSYNDYYDMYAFENMYIAKLLTREEIINYAIKLYDYRIKRFISQFKLTEEEINIFKEKFKHNPSILEYIAYYQEDDKEAFQRRYQKRY